MKKLVFLGLLVAACSQEAPKDTIATVDGEPITKTQMELVLAQFTGLPDARMENYPADFQKELVNKYIEKRLLTKAGYSAGYSKDDVIKKQLKEAEDFLVEQKLLDEVTKQANTTENLKALYEGEVASRDGEKEARARHILVKTEEEAKAIAKKIKAGQSFEKLAEKNSIDPGSKINGGDLGYFTAEKMIPAFSDVVFAMEAGKISEPVKTNFGWHIIKLEDLRDVQIPTFEQSKAALRAESARRAVEAKVAELKGKANIKIDYDFATTPAPSKDPAVEEKAEEKTEEKK